jgi:hypothetical protein
MNRHDMFVELASDQVNQVQQLILENSYESVHSWLHPIFLEKVKIALADFSDTDLEAYYSSQMGVDMPSSPPLSSSDGQEEIRPQAQESECGSVSISSSMDDLTLSLLHTLRNAKSLGEVAPESPMPAEIQASVHWY